MKWIILGIAGFLLSPVLFILLQTNSLFPPYETASTAPIPITPTPTITYIASCPVSGGKIITPSYQADPINGHCGQNYSYNCNCHTSGRRAKAIDIETGGPEGKSVLLPTVQNSSVAWKFIQTFPIDPGEGGGSAFEFEAITENDKWYLQFVHMQSTTLLEGKTYPSGTVVGKTIINHVHTTIGKNIKDPLNSGSSSTDCDSGWLASDFMCSP
jgi:hypothetical protein